ncbi:hypothetical protein AB6G19_05510 [Providencia manganoxydans]|uniref:hypothetical protein n=1 Tax=Providencia manganoxydans TaxID=2923283 RepID=UPI0032DB233A
MKLITVAALLFSTSVMAANQCKPDDVCLVIETGNDIHSVPCSGIKSTKFKYSEKHGNEFVVYVDEEYDFNRFARRNYNRGNEVSIYLLNYKFKLKSIYPRLRDNIAINISHEKVYEAANKVKSCVDSLNLIN